MINLEDTNDGVDNFQDIPSVNGMDDYSDIPELNEDRGIKYDNLFEEFERREEWGNFNDSIFLDQEDDRLDPNNDETIAQRQPWIAKFGAGVGRVGTKVAAEILKMPGVMKGIVEGAAGQLDDLISGKDNHNFMEIAFDNEWINNINEVEEHIKEEYLPVHVRQAVKDGNLWSNLTSIDFWATEGADGVGYIASMLVPGAIINRFNVGARLLGANKFAEMAKGSEKALKNLKAIGYTPKNANVLTATVANTTFEAAAEAKGAMDAFRNSEQYQNLKNSEPQLIEKYKAELEAKYRNEGLNFNNDPQYDAEGNLISGGRIPSGAEVDKYILDEATRLAKKEIDDKVGEIGAKVFGANAAILLGPNLIVSKMLWGGARNKVAKKITSKKGKLEAKTLSTKERINNAGQAFAKAGAREGFFEEGMQSTAETYFTENPDKSLFGDFIFGGEFANAYIDTLGTTDGQKAIALGFAFGGGMQAITDYQQSGKENEVYNKLAEAGNKTLDSFYDLMQNDIYETNEDGIVYETNEETGESTPKIDTLKLIKRLEGFMNIENINDAYDLAVLQGDTETIDNIQDTIITKLIKPFVVNESLGIEVLKEHLDATLKLKNIPSEVVKSRKEFTKRILDKADLLKKEYELIDSFAEVIMKPDTMADVPDNHKVNFLNKKIDSYLNLKSRESFYKGKLEGLETKLKNIVEGKGVDFELYNENPRLRSDLAKQDSRVKAIQASVDMIKKPYDTIQKNLKDYFSDENITKSKEQYAKEYKKVEAEAKKEAEVTKALKAIEEAKTQEELDAIKSPSEVANTRIGEAKSKRSNEIFEAEKKSDEKIASKNAEKADTSEEVTQEELENGQVNPVTGKDNAPKTDKAEYVTEGNEETAYYEVEEEDASGNVYESASQPRIIITNNKKGATILNGVNEAALEYERNPVNKIGQEKSIEINKGNESYTLSENQQKAVDMMENEDYSDIEFLINHLPINIKLADNVVAPLETYSDKKGAGAYNKIFQETTKELRKVIIKEMAVNKTDIKDIKVKIGGQWNGELQLDGNNENSIQDLYDFEGDINNVKGDNIYVADDFGNLKNAKGRRFRTNRPVAPGEVYILVKTAAGRDFPLKLNISKISESQADVLYDIYSYRFDNREEGKNTLLKDLPKEIQDKIKSQLTKEIELYENNKKPYNTLTTKDIIDLLIWDGSTSKKSRVKFYKDNLLIGNTKLSSNVFKSEKGKELFINFLTLNKRRNIRYKRNVRKGEGATSLNLENESYVQYLVANKVLNTNAKVNTLTFSGKTTMYLEKDGTTVKGKVSEFNKDIPVIYRSNLLGTNSRLHKVLPQLGNNPIELNEDGSAYVDAKGNEYDRISTLKLKKGEEKDESINNKPNVYNATKRGDVVDELLRLFFSKNNIDENEFVKYGKSILKKVNKKKPKFGDVVISDSYYKDLHNILLIYKKEFNNRNYTIYANSLPLKGKLGVNGSNQGRYAGSMDILAYDNNNKEWVIIDLKTSTEDRGAVYEGKKKDTWGYMEKDRIQQNGYVELFEQSTGIRPSKVLILPLTSKGDTSENDVYSNIKMSKHGLFLEVDTSKNIYELVDIKMKHVNNKAAAEKINAEIENLNNNTGDTNKETIDDSDLGNTIKFGKMGELPQAFLDAQQASKNEPTPPKTVAKKEPKVEPNTLVYTQDDINEFIESIQEYRTFNVSLNGVNYEVSISNAMVLKYNEDGTSEVVTNLDEVKAVITENNKDNPKPYPMDKANKIWKSKINVVSLQKPTKEDVKEVIEKGGTSSDILDYSKVSDVKASAAIAHLMGANPRHIKKLNQLIRKGSDNVEKLENVINYLIDKGVGKDEIIKDCKL